MRRIIAWLPAVYLTAMWILAFRLDRADRLEADLAALLYGPRMAVLLPGAVLFLGALVFGRSWRALLAALILAAAWALQGVAVGPGLDPARAREPGTLRVLTWNCGENQGQQIDAVVERFEPDVVVVQDYWRGRLDYPHRLASGEFTCFSRFPLKGAKPVLLPADERFRGRRVGAVRFELQWDVRPVAVYAVHLPTPRRQLLEITARWRKRALPPLESTGEGHAWEGDRDAYWDWRKSCSAALAEEALQDPLPVILAGDFNTPPSGPMHAPFRKAYGDAHRQGGHGWGFTFPGDGKGWQARGGPWLRLDRILADKEWEILGCHTDGGERWEHRPVVAEFRPAEG